MASKPTSLRVAAINCDVPAQSILVTRGHYSDIFATLLRTTALTCQDWDDTELVFTAYDAVKGKLPQHEDLAKLDVIVITGSSENILSPLEIFES